MSLLDASPQPAFRIIGIEPSMFVDVQPPGAHVDAARHDAELEPSEGTRPFRLHGAAPSARPGSIIGLPPRRPTVPPERLTGPVSPVARPTDETLFAAAAEPEARLYLPRYRIAEEASSGIVRFRVRLEPEPQGGTLAVMLEKFPAPALAEAARTATEIPHRIVVKLSARIPIGTSHVQQDFLFQEVTLEGTLIKAVLRVDSLAQLTQMFQVLTEPGLSAALTVLRSFEVALPVPIETTLQVQQLLRVIRALTLEVESSDKELTLLEAQRRQLLRMGIARLQIKARLAVLQAQMQTKTTRRNALRAQLQARNAEIAVLRQQKRYQVVPHILDTVVAPQPFAFPKDLHPYIFEGLVPGDAAPVRLSAHQVPWLERSHSYYQQRSQPRRFFFLPDAFKVRRQAEAPHTPMLAVRFPNPDAAPESMTVTLEYVAAPVVDAGRLDAAATDLKRRLPELAGDARPIEFEPLLCDDTRLFITLPRGEGGPRLEERTTATIDLRTGISDAVTLPLRDFQALFDALFGASSVVFHGEALVEIDRSGAIPAERVPVRCRLDDLIGDVLEIDETPDAAAGSVTALFRNIIESPVEIGGVTATLSRGGQTVAAAIRGLADPSTMLLPAATLHVEVTPAEPLPDGDGPDALFTFSRLVVHPAPDAVWDAVVDKSRLPELSRTIKVRTIAQSFQSSPDQGAEAVIAVVVDFERGDSVELNADALEVEASVRSSLEDVVLRKLATGEYRYRLTVVRVSGPQRDTTWRTDRTGILFPDLRLTA